MISRLIRQRNSIKFCANLGKSATETLAIIRQAFGEETFAAHGESKLIETEKREADKEQSHEHAHHFLWHQGDCSQRIRPGRSNSQFRILLRRFTVIA
jgi:hypothetical protein